MKEQDSGKISRDTFRQTIWRKTGRLREEVITGPQYGVDVSVVKLPDGLLLASASDPASLIPDLGIAESAWLTVHLTANDLATTGRRPMFAQFVLNLPITIRDESFEEYWHFIHLYCDQIGVAITGGHTGKVFGQESTFAGGVTMSLVAEEVLLSSYVRPGLTLLVTKTCALSSCAILAKCFPETIEGLLGKQECEEVQNSFWKTSVIEDAVLARETGNVIAFHDVTEGGVVGAVAEMCSAGACGAVIDKLALPVTQSVARISQLFNFDPIRSLGSGALLIACEPHHADEIIETLFGKGIPATVIGYTNDPENGVVVRDLESGRDETVTSGKKDPYWNAYFNALSNGWK